MIPPCVNYDIDIQLAIEFYAASKDNLTEPSIKVWDFSLPPPSHLTLTYLAPEVIDTSTIISIYQSQVCRQDHLKSANYLKAGEGVPFTSGGAKFPGMPNAAELWWSE